ncbi:MAG TPA: TIR domain-containing protein [Rhizomicrobium sp.]|nr:TIR domain-containing protein [Rhizomicrobium sp.]
MAGEIFISYRRADEAWARLLHTLLQAEGVEAWYDAQVGAGQDWRLATAKALEASNIFVLLFTANAAQSSDIAKELAAATLEKKLIIPVRLENIAPKGAFLYELASRNWVNAYDNPEAKLAELAKGLAHLVRTGARDESVLPFDRSGDSGQIPAPSPRKSTRKSAIFAAAAIAAIASAVAAWLLWPEPHWTVESSRPFISTLALEGEPAFSPNGAMLAYTSGKDALSRKIYVRNVAGGDGIKVTNDTYDNISPTWSSDDARLAYVAIKLGEPCRIMVATVPAGAVREAGRCSLAESSAVAWQPGTSFLYYIDATLDRPGHKRSAIFRLDLDTGVRLPVAEQGDFSVLDLHISPDGKWLLFLRDENFQSQRIVIRDLGTGREKSLGTIAWTASETWTGSAAWTADSRTVLTSNSSGIGSEIIAYPVGGNPPYSIYSTTVNIRHLAVGGNGLLAVEADPSRESLARASAKPITQPDLIDPANGITWSPSFAPNGTLAFLSNRSGTNALWVMKPGAVPVQIFDAGTASLFRAIFSPDGTRLATVLSSPKGVIIKIVTVDGASVASFASKSIGFGMPTWTPDGNAVITMDLDILRAVRIEVANPARRTPIAPPYWGAVTIRDNGTFSSRFEKPGVWQIDKGIRLISEKYPAAFSPQLTFRGDDVLIPDFNAAGGPRILAQPVGGGPDRMLAYAPGARTQESFMSKMAVNPKSGEIIYVASVTNDTNIDLLTLAKR